MCVQVEACLPGRHFVAGRFQALLRQFGLAYITPTSHMPTHSGSFTNGPYKKTIANIHKPEWSVSLSFEDQAGQAERHFIPWSATQKLIRYGGDFSGKMSLKEGGGFCHEKEAVHG